MEDQSHRSPVGSLRSDFRTRVASADDRVQTSEESVEQSETPSRRRKEVNTTAQFTGPLAPAQFKLPADLLQSLKLHAINTNETMSEIVLRCLTSADVIEKAWISTRKAS